MGPRAQPTHQGSCTTIHVNYNERRHECKTESGVRASWWSAWVDERIGGARPRAKAGQGGTGGTRSGQQSAMGPTLDPNRDSHVPEGGRERHRNRLEGWMGKVGSGQEKQSIEAETVGEMRVGRKREDHLRPTHRAGSALAGTGLPPKLTSTITDPPRYTTDKPTSTRETSL